MNTLTFRFCGAVALAATPLAVAQPAAYSSPAVRVSVVDDVTGAPIPGAIIAAQWALVRDVMGFARKDGDLLAAHEAVTDAAGAAVLPAFGPMARPAFTTLDNDAPRLLVFALGYYPRFLGNASRATGRDDEPVRRSRWDGQAIRLRSFIAAPQRYEEFDGRAKVQVSVSGTPIDYAVRLGDLQGRIGWRRDDDRWMRHPRMVAAILRARESLAVSLGPQVALISPRLALWGGEEHVRTILEGNGK